MREELKSLESELRELRNETGTRYCVDQLIKLMEIAEMRRQNDLLERLVNNQSAWSNWTVTTSAGACGNIWPDPDYGIISESDARTCFPKQ